jgi:hypothetical protein
MTSVSNPFSRNEQGKQTGPACKYNLMGCEETTFSLKNDFKKGAHNWERRKN